MFRYEWELTKSPAGAWQWTPNDPAAKDTVPDAHDPAVRHAPMMLTTDLALRMDPIYAPISKRFHENPDQFADAFARAWFKLTHRDMGPKLRYLGPEVPAEELIWQDPIPPVTHPLVDAADIAALKAKILAAGLTTAQLVSTAWASACDLPRLRQARRGQRGAHPPGAAEGLGGERAGQAGHGAGEARRGSSATFNGSAVGGKRVSLADLIVLGGCAAVEQAAQQAGQAVTVPFAPGPHRCLGRSRPMRSPSRCSSRSRTGSATTSRRTTASRAEELLLDRAQLLKLTAPEMTVLVGGMRVLGANHGQVVEGVFTKRPGHADERLLRQPARHGNELDAGAGDRAASSRAATARPVRRSGRQPASTWSSARIPAARRLRGLWQRRCAGEVRA